MKKTLLSCLVLILIKLSVQAQGSFFQKVILGVKAGINSSFFTKDVDYFDPSSSLKDPSFQRFWRFSAFAGVTADYMLNDRLSLGAEILYGGKGMFYCQKNNNINAGPWKGPSDESTESFGVGTKF